MGLNVERHRFRHSTLRMLACELLAIEHLEQNFPGLCYLVCVNQWIIWARDKAPYGQRS